MGGVTQQVNLYRDQASEAAAGSAARFMLYSGVAAVALVALLAVAGEVYLSRLAQEQSRVTANLQQQESRLASFREKLITPAIDPFLQAELARLAQTKGRMHNNLNAITRHSGSEVPAFSAFFGALARNRVDGLWFDTLGLSAGGAEMLLKGKTKEPALVPQLLQTLADEPAFSGRTFRKVSFRRQSAEGQGTVDFELRSAGSKEAGDAG
jgi:Tfp pilus assembly protein PilN